MPTNGEIVSEALNDLRLLNIDEHISRRFVLSKFRNRAKTLISQKLLDRTLGSEYNLYREIKCVEMERIDVVECPMVEFRTCNVMMRSVNPLPESVYSRLGIAVKEVTSIDGMFEFIPIDPKQYRRNQRRKVKDTQKMYWAVDSDNHLYLLNSEVEAVNLKMITPKPEDIKSCDQKTDCSKTVWDEQFILPDKLISNTYKDAVFNELASVFRRIQPDENPDGNEYSKQ